MKHQTKDQISQDNPKLCTFLRINSPVGKHLMSVFHKGYYSTNPKHCILT